MSATDDITNTTAKITLIDISGKEHSSTTIDEKVKIGKASVLKHLATTIEAIWDKSGDEDKFGFICQNLTKIIPELNSAEAVDKIASGAISTFFTDATKLLSGGRSRRLKRRRGRKSRRSRR